MKSTSNYKQLRAAIATAARPCLPYIGMFLTDLTFIDSANSSRIGPRKELVNMDKYYRMAATILTAEGFIARRTTLPSTRSSRSSCSACNTRRTKSACTTSRSHAKLASRALVPWSRSL